MRGQTTVTLFGPDGDRAVVSSGSTGEAHFRERGYTQEVPEASKSTKSEPDPAGDGSEGDKASEETSQPADAGEAVSEPDKSQRGHRRRNRR